MLCDAWPVYPASGQKWARLEAFKPDTQGSHLLHLLIFGALLDQLLQGPPSTRKHLTVRREKKLLFASKAGFPASGNRVVILVPNIAGRPHAHRLDVEEHLEPVPILLGELLALQDLPGALAAVDQLTLASEEVVSMGAAVQLTPPVCRQVLGFLKDI